MVADSGTGNGLISPAGPYTLTLGSPLELDPPGTAVDTWRWVVVSNMSPLACQVKTPAGTAQWLPPWTADAYDISTNGPEPVTLTPALTTTAATTGTVTASWYDNQPAGTYPAPLIAQAVSAAISGAVTTAGAATLVASGTASFTGTGTNRTAAVPLASIPGSTRSLVVLLADDSAPTIGTMTGVSTTGATSGQSWFSGAPIRELLAQPPYTPVYGPFYGAVDNTGTLTLTATVITSPYMVSYWVLAMPDADIPVSTIAGSAPTEVGLTTALQQLVAPPIGALTTRRIETVSLFGATAGDIIEIGWASSGTVLAYQFAANSPPFPFPGVLTASSAGLYVANQTAARGFAYASYHDETV